MKIDNKKVMLVIFMQLVIASVFVIGARWASHPVYLFFQSYFAGASPSAGSGFSMNFAVSTIAKLKPCRWVSN